MIGDEKLGQRGVKVRCKKCSYVIIVRPLGYVGSQKKPAEKSEALEAKKATDSESMTDRPVTLPEDAFAPTVPFSGTTPTAGQGDVLPGADAGLSKEFAAMGFDEEGTRRESDPGKSKSLNVGLEIDKMQSAFSDHSSPFQTGRIGGSLADSGDMGFDDDDDSATEARLGPPTRTAPDHEPLQREVSPPERKTELGASIPNLHPHDDDDEPIEETSVDNKTPFKGKTPFQHAKHSSSDDLIAARIGAFETKSELADMESTLNRELGLEEKLGGKPKETKKNGGGGGELPSFTLARNEEARPSEALHADSAAIDQEIGTAFDAMFSPASAPSAGYQDGGLVASTVTDRSPAGDIFRVGSPESNQDKKPTRVFDLSAMQQVQAEQDIAGVKANGNGNGKSAPAAQDTPEWYVAINDEQVGPMFFDDLRERWEKGDISPTTLCWRQGMGDWTPVRSVKEMEALGDMDERVRTVVAHIETSQDVDGPTDEAPPQIAPPEEPKREPPKPKDEPSDEPSWRPSAASALASLAAAELGGESKKSDVAVGRALPATSDALEKLLSGSESKASAPVSPFGAAEMSSSSIRPLPKRTEIVSSMSLRDPISERERRPNYFVFALIIGVALVLGLGIVAYLMRPAREATPVVALNSGVTPANNVVTPPPAAPPTTQQPATPTPTTEVKAPDTAPKSAEPAPTSATPKTESAETDDAKKAKAKHAPKSREGGQGTGERAPKKERHETIAAAAKAPEPPPPPSKPVSEEDDLLGPAKRRPPRVTESVQPEAMPAQLDDGDVLKVMRNHKEAIKTCLTKQKTADPSLDGTMTVAYVIEGSGKTKRWTVSPDKFKASVVGKCVVDSVKTWTFPQFSGHAMPVDFPVKVVGK
jgi:hypothetical protein